jgi:hypothetical protein
MLDVQERAARARVVVSVVQSAVDPGGGGANEAVFGTDNRLDRAEQKTTAEYRLVHPAAAWIHRRLHHRDHHTRSSCAL